MADNYDKQVLIARKLFLKYDQNQMIEKYHLKHDDDYLYLTLLNRMCRVSRRDGIVALCPPLPRILSEEKTEDPAAANDRSAKNPVNPLYINDAYEVCSDYNIVMTIYDLLCYPKERPVLAHQWVPLANLQVTMSSPSADIFSQKYADAFSGKVEQLWNVCQQMGGRRPEILAGADVAWEFDVFPFFPVQLRFWDKDEEFPAQIKLLWDKNALKFMHFETTYYAMHVLLNEIRDTMLKKQKPFF